MKIRTQHIKIYGFICKKVSCGMRAAKIIFCATFGVTELWLIGQGKVTKLGHFQAHYHLNDLQEP